MASILTEAMQRHICDVLLVLMVIFSQIFHSLTPCNKQSISNIHSYKDVHKGEALNEIEFYEEGCSFIHLYTTQACAKQAWHHSATAVFLGGWVLLSAEERSMGKKNTKMLVKAVKQANIAMGP